MNRKNDFTYRGYQELLEAAKKQHVVRDYTNFQRDENFILWRHDIDFDMDNSAVLASMEHHEDIVATYFVLLRTEHYNLFEKTVLNVLNFILAKGHKIGLHFDPHFYEEASNKEIEEALGKEQKLLTDLLGTDIQVFSFHNPTPQILEMEDDKYAGMINTYSTYFKDSVAYASDSNGYWRHDPILKVIQDNLDGGIQVLTHPIWWQAEFTPPKNRIYGFMDSQAQRRKEEYDAALQKYERENKSD